MNLTPDFYRIVAKTNGLSSGLMSPAIEFPMAGDTPVVAVDFDGTLAEYRAGGALGKPGKPLPHAIWALRTFKLNGWEVEIFTVRGEVESLWEWVDRYATGLVDRINESRHRSGDESKSHKPFVDLFIDDRSEYWLGRTIDWVEVMWRLNKNGFLKKGLIPFGPDSVKETNDMIASFDEPIFREIISDLRTEVIGESREDLMREVEKSVKRLGVVHANADVLIRAKVSGVLLESVLKLMVRDRFDPVGCIILAQQDRELDIDTVPPLLEGDVG